MSNDLVAAIDAAVEHVRSCAEQMTRAQVQEFCKLADRVYTLAHVAGLLGTLPQVSELNPELASQDPPLPPVQFISKLNLPGDWARPLHGDSPLPSSAHMADEPLPLPEPAFLVCATPRWLSDMAMFRSLAETTTRQWSEAKSPAEWCKLLGISLTTLKRRVRDGILVVEKITTKSWRISRDSLDKFNGGN